MRLVQCFVLVVMLSAQSVLTSPLPHNIASSMCQTLCPAGEFQKSCTECAPCPPGSYTSESNREESCHDCYRDCKPEYHQRVVQNCTAKSNVRCICEAGYECTGMASDKTNCKYCSKIPETTTAEAATIVSTKDKHTLSPASSGHTRTSAKPCQSPVCGPQTVSVAGNSTHVKTDKISSQLAAILCPVVLIGCFAFVILIFIYRPKDESCFKQAIALLLCNKGGKDASHKAKESTHQFTRDSFSAKQQPSSVSAANLGSIHVHSPGTVIFSLLSQFTGQVGPTIQGGMMTERPSVKDEEDDERDCPVFHPTASPSIHLSEEERSGEMDSIFFPSQEQGKDCHVSKEEVL